MLIGIDGSRAFLEGRTGTENYSYQLIKNMSLIDIENRYLIYLRPGNSLGVKGVEAGMDERSLTFDQIQNWPPNFTFKVLNYPRLWTQVGLALQTFIDPVDVLFVPSHTLPLIRRSGLKTVITVHDLGAEYLPGFHQLKQILYLKLMTHYQIKTATKVISVSEATKRDLVKRIGVKPGEVETVYEGVDKTVFKKMPKDAVSNIVKNYDLERGKYFLFVGTIQPRKNLERLIKSFAEFLKWMNGTLEMGSGKWDNEVRSLISHPTSTFNLVLIGNKGWKSDSIYNLPKELGIEDNVRFLGRVSDQDVASLYNGALGLTFPSLFEGFGLPIVEAFACGCPVITSNTSSMPEVGGDAAILVNPESEEEIFKAMNSLYTDDILRDSLVKKGILRSEKFDWKATARQTIDILERTVKS